MADDPMHPAAAPGGKKKTPTMGPIRTNLEAFGVAILAAVLLKWFCLEAYQIPTSSMQPTLMGSTEAQVFDRIVVDKILPTFREPKRWDITVFQYPLQKNQLYVKRIGGMPNDRLHIGGGNLYQVLGDGEARRFEVVRKPDDLQEAMWKNVFPARQLVRAEAKSLGGALGGSPPRAFREDEDGTIAVALDGAARLFFRDDEDGGFVDRVWDGYPTATARAIREKTSREMPDQEVVPDARLQVQVRPERALDELALEIEVVRPKFDKLTYALVVRGDRARLQVRSKDTQVLGESPEFAFALPAGTATAIGFAHVDEQLIAWHDGGEVQRFDSAAWSCRQGCELNNFKAVLGTHAVTPQVVLKGKGEVQLEDLRIDRDQHYTRSDAPEVIEVPDGHYFMMGDNTRQSIDSRGWTAIEIAVDDQNRVVPPDTPGARKVRGNKRAMPLDRAPDRDETPIGIPSEDCIVMIDEYGEILRLDARVGPDWGNGKLSFQAWGAQDGRNDWSPPEQKVAFVPREDIQGRALLVFYPCRPFAWLFGSAWPNRFGFVR